LAGFLKAQIWISDIPVQEFTDIESIFGREAEKQEALGKWF